MIGLGIGIRRGNIDSWYAAWGGVTYLVLTDGVTTIRRGIRDGYFVTDVTITATGFGGAENTDWANVESVFCCFITANTPTLLTLTVISDTEIQLDWTNAGLDFTGHSIERSADGITYAEIDTVAIGSNHYHDTGLDSYTIYYYRIRAYVGLIKSDPTNVASAETLYPAVLDDADKIAFYDYETLLTQSGGHLIAWKSINGDDVHTEFIPLANTIHVDSDGVRLDAGQSLTGYTAFASPIAQPVFIYALFKRITSTDTTPIIGSSSGTFNLYTWVGNNLRALGGTQSPDYTTLEDDVWHILRLYFNGASSKLIIDDEVPITWNCGTNDLARILIGTENTKWKEIIYRKSAVGEADIYAYLVKKKMNNMDSFLQKYYTKTMNTNNQLNVVMAGDSIFGRMNAAEITPNPNVATGLFPPNMWQQNVAYKVLQKLQYSDADVRYYNLQAWTRNGSWGLDYAFIDGQKVWQTDTLNDYAEITFTGASCFKLLNYTWSGSAANEITILFNGVAPSTLGITGDDTFNTLTGAPANTFYKWANKIWSGLDPNTTYTVRITNTGGLESQIWGCEIWKNKRINVIVSAHGGYTAAEHLSHPQSFLGTMYNPDLIIHDIACLNDSYNVHNKGGKSPSSAAIIAVADDFIFALSGGTFTNYSGLILTAGQYAEYDGANWVAGSGEVTTMLSNFSSNISYLDTIVASGVPCIFIIAHKMTTEANVPWITTMKSTLRTKLAALQVSYIDMDAICITDGWDLNTDLADGTHLNDVSVGYYFDEIEKEF